MGFDKVFPKCSDNPIYHRLEMTSANVEEERTFKSNLRFAQIFSYSFLFILECFRYSPKM